MQHGGMKQMREHGDAKGDEYELTEACEQRYEIQLEHDKT